MNLQSLRDAIDAMYKQLGKYLTADDLKRLETQMTSLTSKNEKNTTDIRHIFELVKELQRSNNAKSALQQTGPAVDLIPINHRLDKLEQGHTALKRIVEDMKIYFGRQIDSLAANNTSAFRLGTPGTPSQHSPISGSEEIQKLTGEIDKLKHLFDEKFNQLLKLIEKRAIKEDVDNLERRMQDQMNDMIQSFIERFADKKELAKKISSIEK